MPQLSSSGAENLEGFLRASVLTPRWSLGSAGSDISKETIVIIMIITVIIIVVIMIIVISSSSRRRRNELNSERGTQLAESGGQESKKQCPCCRAFLGLGCYQKVLSVLGAGLPTPIKAVRTILQW